jgi:hypothetical protein
LQGLEEMAADPYRDISAGEIWAVGKALFFD